MRVGGVIARFKSALSRMRAFADGDIHDIPELSCEKLPFMMDEDGLYQYEVRWSAIASACNA